MKRVLISPSAFKLSKQGYDASQASEAQLVFDAFGGVPYNGVYLAGYYPPSALSNNGGAWVGTVNLGNNFSKVPQALVKLTDPFHSGGLMHDYFAQTENGQQVDYVQSLTTTSLTVAIQYTGSYFPSQLGFLYVIMQF